MPGRVHILLFLLCIPQIPSKDFIGVGPFKIITQSLEKCEDEGTKEIQLTDIKLVKRENDQPFYDIQASVKNGINDKTFVTAHIEAKKKNNYELYLTKGLGGFCMAFKKYMPLLMNRLLKASGLTGCPIPAGNYSLKNLGMDIDFNLPAAAYGKYRAYMLFNHNRKERIGCIKLLFELVPKSLFN